MMRSLLHSMSGAWSCSAPPSTAARVATRARLRSAPVEAEPDGVLRFVKSRLLAVQPSQAGFGIGRDGGKRLKSFSQIAFDH